MNKHRFYCPTCKRLLDRRKVTIDEWEGIYFCKWCDNAVMRVDKIQKKVIMDMADWLISHGEEEDYQ